MRKSKLSGRETVMVVVLLILVVGVVYYMGFYSPLQSELVSISGQIADVDAQISTANGKLSKMDKMQAELDEILSSPENEISEIAPYDNKEEVLNQLNRILASSQYNLSFSEPTISEDGAVRRSIAMNFTCSNFKTVKSIIKDLTECRWRCMVSNLSVSGGNNIMGSEISVSATVTFFESTIIE